MTFDSSAPLVLPGVLGGAACLWLRRRSPPTWLRGVILVALVGSELVVMLWPIEIHQWAAASTLPLQLSDITTIVCAVSLVLPRMRWFVELAYLWSIPAGLLGLSFPAIGASAPSPLFYAFYVDHGTLLFYGLLLLFDRSLRLGAPSIGRACAATVIWAMVAGVANLATGGDYMFLREPPPTWSPLLLMGPWPWYVFSSVGVALVVFIALAWPKLGHGDQHPNPVLQAVPSSADSK